MNGIVQASPWKTMRRVLGISKHTSNIEIVGLSWESVDSDVIRDWMESLMDKGDMASSVNFYLSAVRSFFRFALSRGLVKRDPSHLVKGPKKQKPLPQFVRESEMDRLFDMPQMWEHNYKGTRARTIVLLFYSTGIRLAELVGLNTLDVDFFSHQLKVTGKRNKQRIIPFGEEFRGGSPGIYRIAGPDGRRTNRGVVYLGGRCQGVA